LGTAAFPRKRALERAIGGFRGFTFVLNEVKEMGIIYGTGSAVYFV